MSLSALSPPRTRRRCRRKATEDSLSTTELSSNQSLQSVSNFKRNSDNLFSYLDNELTQEFETKFEKLFKLRKENSVLENKLKECVATKLNTITEEVGIKSGDVEERLTKIEVKKNQKKSEIQTIKQNLKQRKSEKTKLEKKYKTLSKQLSQLNTEKEEIENIDTNEAKLLSNIMNCKYTISSNQKVVSLTFNDTKRKQRLVAIDGEDIHKEFWSIINKKYKI